MSDAAIDYLTPEVLALVGAKGPKVTAPVPLTEERLRRFMQGVMEDDPIHWDHEAAAASRYGEIVATPLWPGHAFVRAAGTPDPLDRLAEDPEWDGAGGSSQGGLPPLDLPLVRILNGGTEAEFFQLAKVGDVISSQAEYADITQREGRSGTLVIVRVRTVYTNQDDDVLVVVTSSLIRR
jgi:acyl dehydratase